MSITPVPGCRGDRGGAGGGAAHDLHELPQLYPHPSVLQRWVDGSGRLGHQEARDQGNVHIISLMGIDNIASIPGSINLSIAYLALPHIPAHTLDRPHGEVGLLLGQDNVTQPKG